MTRDDARQVAAAERFIAPGAWVSWLALAEATWVLTATYGRTPAQVAAAIEMVLAHANLTVQDADAAISALASYRAHPGLGFADCLMLEAARKAGHLPFGTFDRRLARLEGAQRL